jgi:hypothetical protein
MTALNKQALREELEICSKDRMRRIALALLDELEAAEKRIAEMEARNIALPDRVQWSVGGDWSQSQCFGWNMAIDACRAAMLQSEPVSNSDELPLDYLQGHKDGLAWAAQLAEANHPQTGDWLYDDPVALAAAIRKGPDMPEFKSVSVDEDDNFYSWFGRFWYENYQKNNYTTSAKQMLGTMAEFAYRAGRESAALAGNSPVTPDGLAAAAPSGIQMIPDGYVMVPKDPTAKMYDAGDQQMATKQVWDAMIAAAPQPQNSPQNIPEIIPGWIPVSERMPEVGVKVLCFPVEDEPIHASFNGQLWLQDISWSVSDESIDNVISCNVTHWMPLPASPQQEVNP